MMPNDAGSMDVQPSYESLLRECSAVGSTTGRVAFVVLTTLLHPHELLDPVCTVHDGKIRLRALTWMAHPLAAAVLGGNGSVRDLLAFGGGDRTSLGDLAEVTTRRSGSLSVSGLHNLVPIAARDFLASTAAVADRRAMLAHLRREFVAPEAQLRVNALVGRRLRAAGYAT